MRNELIALIERASLRGYIRELKKVPALMTWVIEQTGSLPAEAELAERVYVAVHGSSEAICPYGQHKIFNTFNKGFRFCATGCQCRREEQARKITAHQAAVSVKERARRQEAQRQTLIEKHGVTNAMHIPAAREALIATNNERFGGNSPMASEAVRSKIKQTNQERLGVSWPGQSKTVMDKVRATNLARHGHPTTMHLARAAFKEQTGFNNPFEMEVFKTKALQTMISRYGVEKALQNPDILAKMIADVTTKWGVPSVLMAPAIKQKIAETVMTRYNRRYVNQEHIADDAYAILQDCDAFVAMFETRSLREVALELGISYDGARKYCERYKVRLPRSTGEDAVVNFLRGYGFAVQQTNRRLIKPKELDIVLHDQKLAIEYCGLYYHGEKLKPDRNYHLDKLKAVSALGYRLLTIFEDEWITSREVVCSRLLHILGHGERGKGARQLEIRTVPARDAKSFYDLYHLQGHGQYGYLNLGAYDDDALVALMSFSRGRVPLGSSSRGPLELLRFATDGRNHPGVASRLFRDFLRRENPDKVISYADRRWSDGGLYRSLGFAEETPTEPNYWYVHNNRFGREYRFKYRKDQIKHRVENGEMMSENEIMTELGYYRIWDCGSFKFLWTRKTTEPNLG